MRDLVAIRWQSEVDRVILWGVDSFKTATPGRNERFRVREQAAPGLTRSICACSCGPRGGELQQPQLKCSIGICPESLFREEGIMIMFISVPQMVYIRLQMVYISP